MPDPKTSVYLKSLILSANDLRQMTDWPDALIEDYLNILRNILVLSETIDGGLDKKIEGIDTDFSDGSIPFAEGGYLIEDTDLFWDNIAKALLLPNTGLKIYDTNSTHTLNIKPGSNLTAERTLTFITDDASRVITLIGSPTLDNWFDQAVKTTSSPTFLKVYITDINQYIQENSGDLELVTAANQTVLFNPNPWDDLQVSILSVRIPASSAPTWRDYDHGIAAGVTFPVLGFSVGDYIYFDIQSSHSMKLNTILDNHIHFCTPTDGTGDRFNFQLDVIAAEIHGTWAVPTGSPFTSELLMADDYSDQHQLLEIADIPAVNSTVSTVYKCRLERIAASADEYAGEIYLEYTDCHYQKDTIGSRQEDAK